LVVVVVVCYFNRSASEVVQFVCLNI